MTDENDTPQGGAGEAVPDAAVPANQTPAKSDAEEDARKAQSDAKAGEPDKGDGDKKGGPEGDKPDRKRNRTRQYIERINGENAELRKRLADFESRLPKPEEPKPPNPEDFYNDPTAYQDRLVQHRLDEAKRQWEKDQQQQAEQRKQQEITQTYAQAASAFAEQHEDFHEAVGSIDARLLSDELQAAIMAQENGPAIAYHLANSDDELWQLATLRPELVPMAVDRLSARLKAAPEAGNAPAPSTPAPAPEAKPISQTPPPVPRVSGRSPTEVPPEKMTDDEWYRRERDRRRKR